IPDDIRTPFFLGPSQQLQTGRYISGACKGVVCTNPNTLGDGSGHEIFGAFRYGPSDVDVGAAESRGVDHELDQVCDVVVEISRSESDPVVEQSLCDTDRFAA